MEFLNFWNSKNWIKSNTLDMKDISLMPGLWTSWTVRRRKKKSNWYPFSSIIVHNFYMLVDIQVLKCTLCNNFFCCWRLYEVAKFPGMLNIKFCVCIQCELKKKGNQDSILNLSKSKRKIMKLLSVDDGIFIFLSYGKLVVHIRSGMATQQ